MRANGYGCDRERGAPQVPGDMRSFLGGRGKRPHQRCHWGPPSLRLAYGNLRQNVSRRAGCIRSHGVPGPVAYNFRNVKLATWGPILMPMNFHRFWCAAALAGAVSLYAADKSKPAPAAAAVDPYSEIQPATECVDLNMYERIRDEGLNRSH